MSGQHPITFATFWWFLYFSDFICVCMFFFSEFFRRRRDFEWHGKTCKIFREIYQARHWVIERNRCFQTLRWFHCSIMYTFISRFCGSYIYQNLHIIWWGSCFDVFTFKGFLFLTFESYFIQSSGLMALFALCLFLQGEFRLSCQLSLELYTQW